MYSGKYHGVQRAPFVPAHPVQGDNEISDQLSVTNDQG